MNKTINVRKNVQSNASFTYEEAEAVLKDTASATAEACANAAETYSSIMMELKGNIVELKSAANLKAEVYGLTYDEDNIQMSIDGTEMLMTDANGEKWWVKMTPSSSDVDIGRLNDMMRETIFNACTWIQSASQQLHLFDIRFEHNRVLEDAHLNAGTLPDEMKEFFVSKQLSLFAEELNEKKIRRYDGQQSLSFNIMY